MRDPQQLASLGSSTLGVWRRHEALQHLTPDEIAHDLAEGTLQSPFPGTYLDAGHEPDSAQWLAIAVLASSYDVPAQLHEGDPVSALVAVGCGRTAARELGMPLIDDDDPATGVLEKVHHDVAVFRHLEAIRSRPRRGQPQQTLHRHQLRLQATDLVQHRSGLYLTGHLRTLFDLTALLTPEALVCAMDWALHHGHVTAEQLEQYADLHKGWRSTPAFRRAIERADGRAESALESLTRLLLKPVWPDLVPQVRLYDSRGLPVARLDHAVPEIRLAVESDGRAAHSGEIMKAKDDRRDRRVSVQHGYRTERVTWYDVRRRQHETLTRLVTVRAAREAELRAAAA